MNINQLSVATGCCAWFRPHALGGNFVKSEILVPLNKCLVDSIGIQ